MIPVALALLLLQACAPLDRRPLVSTPAYGESFRAIDHAAALAPASTGRYRAGWAKVELAVPPGAPLAGYGEREGAPSTGVRDPVYVRAFAIDAGDPAKRAGSAVVIFTADLLLSPPNVAAEVRARLRGELDPSRLFFTASHTHSGPGGLIPGLIWELVFGPYDPRAFEAAVSAHVRAAREALEDMAPARVGAAEVRVPGLIANRVERGGPTDDHLFVLSLSQAEGRRAALWSFGCHAVTLPASNTRVSADYPGEIAAKVEGSGLEVLGFAAGGVGSSNPRHERPADTSWLTGPLLDALRRGLDAAERGARDAGSIASAQLVIDAPPPRYRVGADTMLWPVLTQAIVDTSRAPLGAVALGDVVLVHQPGELSGELTRAARAAARDRGIRLAMFPFNGGYAGYVVPRRVYDLPDARGEELLHYETRTMAFFGPYGADLFMSLSLELAQGVHAKAREVERRSQLSPQPGR